MVVVSAEIFGGLEQTFPVSHEFDGGSLKMSLEDRPIMVEDGLEFDLRLEIFEEDSVKDVWTHSIFWDPVLLERSSAITNFLASWKKRFPAIAADYAEGLSVEKERWPSEVSDLFMLRLLTDYDMSTKEEFLEAIDEALAPEEEESDEEEEESDDE